MCQQDRTIANKVCILFMVLKLRISLTIVENDICKEIPSIIYVLDTENRDVTKGYIKQKEN